MFDSDQPTTGPQWLEHWPAEMCNPPRQVQAEEPPDERDAPEAAGDEGDIPEVRG